MFDEDKINELLRGASPKKKASSSKKKPPEAKKITKKKEAEQSEISNPKAEGELTPESLQEMGTMMVSGARTESATVRQSTQKEKTVSIKNIQKRQEYIHERKLAEDRLRRLKQAEKRIEELERERKEATRQITEDQTATVQQMQRELERNTAIFAEQQTRMEDIISQQKEQIQTFQKEKERLWERCLTLQNTIELEEQKQQEGKEITQVFQEHGLHSDEYRDVIAWLIQTGIFPLSYVQTQHYDLLKQILHDKCHIQAANIPLPKESNDIYIDASLERCPLSGGHNIIDQARSFKDECLIHGYTTIVMFGTQGPYEQLFQILFAHHALRVTLSPPMHTLSAEEIQKQIQANQLSFSWGGAKSFDVNHTSKKQTVGGFLNDLVSCLRSML